MNILKVQEFPPEGVAGPAARLEGGHTELSSGDRAGDKTETVQVE